MVKIKQIKLYTSKELQEKFPDVFKRVHDRFNESEPPYYCDDDMDNFACDLKEEYKFEMDTNKSQYNIECGHACGCTIAGRISFENAFKICEQIIFKDSKKLNRYKRLAQIVISQDWAGYIDCTVNHRNGLSINCETYMGYVKDSLHKKVMPFVDEVVDCIDAWVRSESHKLYKILKADYEYMTSDEYFHDMAERNNWLYDNDGSWYDGDRDEIEEVKNV